MKALNLKYLMATAVVLHEANLNGKNNYEECQTLLNKGMKQHGINQDDISGYFTSGQYKDDSAYSVANDPDPTPQEILIRQSTKEWQALEYFEII